MTWKIEPLPNHNSLVLRLSGRIEKDSLAQLENYLQGLASVQDVALDLRDVKLVDQESVAFLARCAGTGIKLLDPPLYIREWIDRLSSTLPLRDE